MKPPSPPDDDDSHRRSDDEKDAEGRHEGTSLRPSLSRLYSVAAGISTWTAEEKEWLARHPEWAEREAKVREAINDVKAGREPDDDWFAKFIKRSKRRSDDPPTRQ